MHAIHGHMNTCIHIQAHSYTYSEYCSSIHLEYTLIHTYTRKYIHIIPAGSWRFKLDRTNTYTYRHMHAHMLEQTYTETDIQLHTNTCTYACIGAGNCQESALKRRLDRWRWGAAGTRGSWALSRDPPLRGMGLENSKLGPHGRPCGRARTTMMPTSPPPDACTASCCAKSSSEGGLRLQNEVDGHVPIGVLSKTHGVPPQPGPFLGVGVMLSLSILAG
jgi:hypothetical protein